MIYLGQFSLFRHVLLCLLPRGNFRGLLRPMHDRGLITPVEQLGHGFAMGAAGAISVHRRPLTAAIVCGIQFTASAAVYGSSALHCGSWRRPRRTSAAHVPRYVERA